MRPTSASRVGLNEAVKAKHHTPDDHDERPVCGELWVGIAACEVVRYGVVEGVEGSTIVSREAGVDVRMV